MHVSVNDSCALQLLRLYKKNYNSMALLIYRRGCQSDIPPYILSDKGFRCISWPMTHCKGGCFEPFHHILQWFCQFLQNFKVSIIFLHGVHIWWFSSMLWWGSCLMTKWLWSNWKPWASKDSKSRWNDFIYPFCNFFFVVSYWSWIHKLLIW
jgi:hypothetical protein